MSLQAKILQLKLEAALAVRHANGWQKLIDTYGEDRATAFYRHLGLNHLPVKSVEWEGLKLSREPKEHEKLAVKGIAQAQDSAKQSITDILLSLRTELITDGIDGIRKLSSSTYHKLILDTPAEFRTSLRDRLLETYRQGRQLVVTELGGKQSKADDDDFDELDELTDLTSARIANDVQARIIGAATRFALLGQTGTTLINSVTNDINSGSVSYIDRAATGLANRTLNVGREDEFEERADDIDRYEQSALLDPATCQPCFQDDGLTASDPGDLPGGPNPSCLGSDYCRCFIVAIAD